MEKIPINQIKEKLLQHAIFNKWPQLIGIIERYSEKEGFATWDYVVWACELVGGNKEDAINGSISNLCMFQSIHLVDDLLDEDPSGYHIQNGVGTTANISHIFSSLASLFLEDTHLSESSKIVAFNNIAQTILDTAYGQNEDIHAKGTEEDYWRIVKLKTPPLFCSAIFIGGLLGGVEPKTARLIAELGYPLGKLIQLNDDLADIFKDVNTTDWEQPEKNIVLIYCLNAAYEKKERFLKLLANLDTQNNITELQGIALECGAVSFCLYNIIETYKEALKIINQFPTQYQKPSKVLFEYHIQKIVSLLNKLGLNVTFDDLVNT
ncbi:polyprenyl synthetase family protein [Kordia sp.]|uniref:polyprenyl synthetase family protein n=1 Tax=Kordia sp. TaxID=1965332 RepID=UPI003D6BFA97